MCEIKKYMSEWRVIIAKPDNKMLMLDLMFEN